LVSMLVKNPSCKGLMTPSSRSFWNCLASLSASQFNLPQISQVFIWSRTDQQRVGPIIGRRASKPLISTKYQLHNKLNINSTHPLPRRPVSYQSNAFAKEVLVSSGPDGLSPIVNDVGE
jgi:hypothetical protein